MIRCTIAIRVLYFIWKNKKFPCSNHLPYQKHICGNWNPRQEVGIVEDHLFRHMHVTVWYSINVIPGICIYVIVYVEAYTLIILDRKVTMMAYRQP